MFDMIKTAGTLASTAGLLGLGAFAATASGQGSALAVRDADGPRVTTSGNARAVSGTFTENGFEGVASGPEGRYRIGSDRHELDGDLRRPTRARTRHLPNGVTVMEGPGTLIVGDGFGPVPAVGFGPGGSVHVDVPGVHLDVPGTTAVAPTPREIGRLIRAERYADAIELADAALLHDRRDADCLQLRALAAFLDGDYRDAAYDAYDALELAEPFDWERIETFTTADEYTDALRELQQEAEEDARRADLQLLLAYHGLVLGDEPAACEHLRNVLGLKPREPLALELLDRYDPRPHAVPPSLGDPIE